MIGQRNRADAEEFLQLIKPPSLVSDLAVRHRTRDHDGRLRTEVSVVSTRRADLVGVVPFLVPLEARHGLDPRLLQEGQGPLHVLVVQARHHDQPVRQRSYTQSADLRHARATVHQNVVVRGLDRRLEAFYSERPVREYLGLEIEME